MLWGMSDAERAERYRGRSEYLSQWHEWFAWMPVLLIDGKWAWLQSVYWTGFVENPSIPPSTRFTHWLIFGRSYCYSLHPGIVYPRAEAPAHDR